MKQRVQLLGAVAAMSLVSKEAFAHHPLDGAMPGTMAEGLISGFAHPVIGIDHLAFVILAALATAFVARPSTGILALIAGTLLGCTAYLGQIALPASEVLIALSVLLLGVVVMSGNKLSSAGSALALLFAGLFHGFAYGAGIIGAEATPLASYLIGFAAIQAIIMFGVQVMARSLWTATREQTTALRLSGAMLGGVGLTFVLEHVEAFAFAM